MINKTDARMRRAARTRRQIKKLQAYRFSIYKSLNHIYAQLISPDGSRILASASTLDVQLRKKLDKTGNKQAAAEVGKLIAERIKKLKLDKAQIAVDRSGYQYHGRVKALVESAREAGLAF